MKKQRINYVGGKCWQSNTWSHFLYCSPERTRWNPYLRDMEGLDNK